MLAGLTAITELYNRLTKDSREARKAAEDHLEVLKRLREEQRDPAAVVGESVASGEAALATLRERIQRVADQQQAALQSFLRGNGEAFGQAQRFAQRLLDLNREYLDLVADVGAGITRVGQIGADVDEARIDRLTALLSLGAAQRTEAEQLARVLADSRAEVARTSATDEKGQQRRLELLKRIAEIEGAQKAALELDTKPAVEAAKALRDEVQATATALTRAQEAAAGLGQPFTCGSTWALRWTTSGRCRAGWTRWSPDSSGSGLGQRTWRGSGTRSGRCWPRPTPRAWNRWPRRPRP